MYFGDDSIHFLIMIGIFLIKNTTVMWVICFSSLFLTENHFSFHIQTTILLVIKCLHYPLDKKH